jgi:hypothetical protein
VEQTSRCVKRRSRSDGSRSRCSWSNKSEETSFPSEFVARYAIDSIPHFVVVNRRGIVAASLSNRFQDALAIAEGLAKAKD